MRTWTFTSAGEVSGLLGLKSSSTSISSSVWRLQKSHIILEYRCTSFELAHKIVLLICKQWRLRQACVSARIHNYCDFLLVFTYVLDYNTHHLIQLVLLSIQNICFGWEITKLIFEYALLSEGLAHFKKPRLPALLDTYLCTFIMTLHQWDKLHNHMDWQFCLEDHCCFQIPRDESFNS